MGWLSKIFGSSDNKEPKKGPSAEHKGLIVTAMPESRGAQFQTAGEIRPSDPADERVHHFIRADVHPRL